MLTYSRPLNELLKISSPPWGKLCLCATNVFIHKCLAVAHRGMHNEQEKGDKSTLKLFFPSWCKCVCGASACMYIIRVQSEFVSVCLCGTEVMKKCRPNLPCWPLNIHHILHIQALQLNNAHKIQTNSALHLRETYCRVCVKEREGKCNLMSGHKTARLENEKKWEIQCVCVLSEGY